jgi:hypothetical protein
MVKAIELIQLEIEKAQKIMRKVVCFAENGIS